MRAARQTPFSGSRERHIYNAILEGLPEVLWRLRLPHSGSVGSMTAPASMWSEASDSVIVVSPLEPPSMERANAAAEVLGTVCGNGSCTS